MNSVPLKRQSRTSYETFGHKEQKWLRFESRPADHVHDPGVFICRALQGLPPGGHVIEKVLHLRGQQQRFIRIRTVHFQRADVLQAGTRQDLGPLVPGAGLRRALQFAIAVACSEQQHH